MQLLLMEYFCKL